MILLTGATGYIGSHIWVELLRGSKTVIGIDNFTNSKAECLEAVSKITQKGLTFFEGDIRDKKFLTKIFSDFSITHVIHLAALKDIKESITHKEDFFDVNVSGFKNLLTVMRGHGCLNIIFSSSAAVYGGSSISPVSESSYLNPSNYYGETKVKGEHLLAYEFDKPQPINSVSLRYFNVAGKHPSGILQGYELAKSHSLFSEIEKVITGQSKILSIFGDDWGTHDGTCIRDYLHISDLVKGHLDALNLLDGVCTIFNLGLGVGQSVYDVVSTYESVVGYAIPKAVSKRRNGDIGESFADTALATRLLGWSPKKTLFDMCRDSYRPILLNAQQVTR
jgi:UDP-glucose 4-epimerase